LHHGEQDQAMLVIASKIFFIFYSNNIKQLKFEGATKPLSLTRAIQRPNAVSLHKP
jgi:hypothetical protein